MESIFESRFGLKFWKNNKRKQKEIESKIVKRNLIATSDCLAGRHYSARFAGNRDFDTDHLTTGLY